ncbi:thiamine pyrophosphate-binding protein [Dorea sp. YH-dor228]|uniref:thiamine pyrophosphate-binding protein n=1 Tax=Dorea sp. YH-dor228 TaxID=3151120 RepID=UPI003242703F
MDFYYSSNENVQILVALLKAHGIKRVIASPGTTNLELMVSLQHDDFFEMYSCVDERSAAYMACGLATETNEPVVITCTEATASRDYYPGLTEAFHRKLPILAVTGLHDYKYIGQLEPQVIDRRVSPLDTMKKKINLPVIKDENDWKESELRINEAILELKRKDYGPVHINMPWNAGKFDFSVKTLPYVRKIDRYFAEEDIPSITAKKIAVLIGGHSDWNKMQTEMLDAFCKAYDAIVICDHTSKYYGKYRAQCTLLAIQKAKTELLQNIDLLIHIGEEFGDDETKRNLVGIKEVWRVSPDGELRDTFGKLTKVFEMQEETFFRRQIRDGRVGTDSYINQYKNEICRLEKHIPDLPFSSVYVASRISQVLPNGSMIHLGVSDTIRAWNMFRLPEGVKSRCNSGCRGIDGCVSALMGASLADKNRIFFGVFGDLTFFYDMNVLGNRYVQNNVRIIVVNNNGGNIFRHNGHTTQKWLGLEKTNLYVAAGGHFGNQSPALLKHFAEDLGFEYLSASSKEEFSKIVDRFTVKELTEKPMVLEIFTETVNDSNAFDIMGNILLDSKGLVKEAVKSLLGEQGTAFMKRFIKK